jgi:adenylyltransferase/sulfurtransferase
MEKYFNRQIQLWGLDTQKNLQNKHILIVGCGGLGCSLAMALGASGIGEITLLDFDEVGVHNIHRQIGFKVGDEGKKKCEVLKQLVLDRCPYVKVNAIDASFEQYTALDNRHTIDLILDGTDNLPVRAKIDEYSKQINTPWIYASVEEFHGQICFFKEARFESVFSVKEKTPGGIACPIVMNIASFQANLAIRYLCDLKVKKDFLYYVFINDEGEYTLQKFGLPV